MLGEQILDEFTHAGFRVHVGYDGDVHPDTNPRSEPSARVGVMVMRDMPRYPEFADETWDDQDVDCERCNGTGEVRGERPLTMVDCPECTGIGSYSIDPLEYARRQGARVALGLYFRAHGPQCTVGTNSVNLIDDAELNNEDGVIFDTPNDVRANGWHRDEQAIIDALALEVKCMGWYLEGSVYAYEILNADGEVVDSCYGFLDANEDYCTREAQAAAELLARREKGMTNEDRADHGARAIKVGSPDVGKDPQGEDETTITEAADCVANVLHHVARQMTGIDADEAVSLVLERARTNFDAEYHGED